VNAEWYERLFDLIREAQARGVAAPRGSGLTFGEACSLAILHPVTGEWLTPAQIAKRVQDASKPRAVK